MRVNKIKFSKNKVNVIFIFPSMEKTNRKLQKMLLGYTYPLVENFNPKLILDVDKPGATSIFLL